MAGSSNLKTDGYEKRKEWLVEWVLPGLFALVLLGCLAHLGYFALQGSLLPTAGFQYAISAFAT